MGKEKASDAFDTLTKKYQKFNKCLVDSLGMKIKSERGKLISIDNLKTTKEELVTKMEDFRYSLIDEIKEFYESEIQHLQRLQSKIDSNEYMQNITNQINNLSADDTKIKHEDSALLDPITIKRQDTKIMSKDNDKNQLHISYQVGEDLSNDSEELKGETPPKKVKPHIDEMDEMEEFKDGDINSAQM